MFEKIKQLWALFKVGNEVADLKFWQQQQAVVLPVVTSLLVALFQLAKAYGISSGLDENSIGFLALALYGVVNTAITIVTSKHLGLPAPKAMVYHPQPSVAEPQDAPQEPVSERFDEDTLARAKEWLSQNKKA